MGLAPEAGDLDSDANSSSTGGKGEAKEGSKDGILGYTNISGREGGGWQARVMSEEPGKPALLLPGRERRRQNKPGPSHVYQLELAAARDT